MLNNLPNDIQFKLTQVLGQWRQWRCDPPLLDAPVIDSRLTQGISNFSVRVSSVDRAFVIRLDGVNPTLNGLNRQAEWRILQLAATAKLAPPPLYYNPDLGCLVCEYLPHDACQPTHLVDVAKLLRGIHALPVVHHRLNLGERFLRYEKMVARQKHPTGLALLGYSEQVGRIREKASQRDSLSVLCHNDLNASNQLYSYGQLWALDWEYSAMGSPWFDLATTALGLELNDTQTAELLALYLQRPAEPEQLELLEDYAVLGQYMELLWHLAQKNTSDNPIPLSQKLNALAARLAKQSS